jgi:heme exporter protein D
VAVKREKSEPLLEDVALCVQMGWSFTELEAQPVQFVERLKIYLAAVADRQRRESQQAENDLRRKLESLGKSPSGERR